MPDDSDDKWLSGVMWGSTSNVNSKYYLMFISQVRGNGV